MAKKKFTADEIPDLEELESNSILNLFDLNNPDINFFNHVDDELVKIAGSRIHYYKFYRDDNIDEVYGEARNKVILSEPIEVHGIYDPREIEEHLTQFGIELTNDQIFTFNKKYIERRLGRLPIPGDVLKPKFQNIKYEIYQAQESSFEIYGVYHIICSAKVLRDSEDVVNEPLDRDDNIIGKVDNR